MIESFQITAVGDGFVGKTCMLLRYTTDLIPNGYEPTVFENYVGKIEIEGKEYNIQLWDTAGQEDYDRLRPLSYKMTDCFLICYSIDSQNSYENVADKWAPEVKHFKPRSPIILVGTKTDLRNDPETYCLREEDGIKLKDSIRAKKYIECSSVTRQGIDDVFQEAVKAVLNQRIKKTKCRIF
ncbi:hypothetical protein ILUMI_01862 [Ignelater luminosus]|uniref:Uncharacterized protein n=1 Tax=Ignelater luminosus TaxID=2038154 RepID=A0A8K0DDS5_IGNLU|nr:hypothetical protein ILUMI_01862 [Ignelater luminosus]